MADVAHLPPPWGLWLLATAVLHRPVPVTGAYPHVCRLWGVGTAGRRVRLQGRDCAACQLDAMGADQ